MDDCDLNLSSIASGRIDSNHAGVYNEASDKDQTEATKNEVVEVGFVPLSNR